MSEKKQRTAANMREQMIHRYGDGLHHKHNKNHNPYRQHFRSHPIEVQEFVNKDEDAHEPTGQIRQFKLRKIRKRLDKGRFH